MGHMRNGMKSALVGAALLTLVSGCGSEDECTTQADCADQPALEAGQVYACRERRCVAEAEPVPVEPQCTVSADCASQPALPAGQVYACREQACTATPQPYAVYGLQDDGRRVYALGTWPTLSAGTTALFDVFAPADRGLDPAKFQIFAGGYLANDGTRLLSGYTKPDVSGQVALYTPGAAEAQYVSVPGNLSATAHAGTFYVSALKAPSFSAGAAVYALKDTTASIVADTGSTASASGQVAIATHGAAAFGFADPSANYVNRLFTLAPTAYAAPASPVDLTTQTSLELGETFEAATFGTGIAVLRGTQNPSTFARTYSDVVRVELSATGAASAPATVLRFVDQCSRVSLESPMGENLLVRITDHEGKNAKLVRIGRSSLGTVVRTPAADCATAQRDPVLGTLQLEPGFGVVDSTALPEGVGAVTAVPTAP
jgi:hypothetical protein